MAAYHRVDDLRSPAGWLPVHRDQLRAQRSVSSKGSLYLFFLQQYSRGVLSKKDGTLDTLTRPASAQPNYSLAWVWAEGLRYVHKSHVPLSKWTLKNPTVSILDIRNYTNPYCSHAFSFCRFCSNDQFFTDVTGALWPAEAGNPSSLKRLKLFKLCHCIFCINLSDLQLKGKL